MGLTKCLLKHILETASKYHCICINAAAFYSQVLGWKHSRNKYAIYRLNFGVKTMYWICFVVTLQSLQAVQDKGNWHLRNVQIINSNFCIMLIEFSNLFLYSKCHRCRWSCTIACHEGIWGSGGIAPPIFNLVIRWTGVACIMSCPLYPQ
jgi:hypothetical protein